MLPRGGDDGHKPTAERPVVRSPWWGPRVNNYHHGITSVNARMQAFASSHTHKHWLRYIDCSAPLLARAYSPADQLLPGHLDTGAAQPPSASEHKYLPPHVFYDLLHLTPEGYRLWAQCLGPHVASAVDGAKEKGSLPSASRRGRRSSVLGSERDEAPDCVGRSCRGGPGEIDLA